MLRDFAEAIAPEVCIVVAPSTNQAILMALNETEVGIELGQGSEVVSLGEHGLSYRDAEQVVARYNNGGCPSVFTAITGLVTA